jgi:ADP-ribose pyrophosphatase YjhB (NUDIX family)
MISDILTKTWVWAGRIAFYAGWPFIWLYLRGTVRTRVIILAEGKVLLVKSWLSPGNYNLPGGGLRHGEEAENGAAREVFEETKLRLDPKSLEYIGNAAANENGITFTAVIFRYTCTQPFELHNRRFAFESAAWIPLRQLTDNAEVNQFTKQTINAREV